MSRTERIRDTRLGEEAQVRKLSCGLTVLGVRKPAFTRSYATLATQYGSVDTSVRLNGHARRVPDGTAHFLEHKVFQTPEGDAFDLFAALGGSANAFTSFNSTRYLFSTSSDFWGNLGLLLDMVFDLTVDEAGIEKEKGIIGQEISMYDDDPDWRLYFGLLQALYVRHPVRLDIAGTRETIAGIDVKLLQAVHRQYYHPSNMALAAVTGEPLDRLFRFVDERLRKRSFGRAPARSGAAAPEPHRVGRRRLELRLPVNRPRLVAGFKDAPSLRRGLSLLKREVASAMALDCLFGSAGSVFNTLYERGLVDEGFYHDHKADRGYAFTMAGGETDDVGRLQEALEQEIGAALERGIGAADLERVRNKAWGDLARAFNSPDAIAQMLVGHHFRGTRLPDFRRVLDAVTPRALTARLRQLLDPRSRAYCAVLPG